MVSLNALNELNRRRLVVYVGSLNLIFNYPIKVNLASIKNSLSSFMLHTLQGLNRHKSIWETLTLSLFAS
jgi:hypothetical protein